MIRKVITFWSFIVFICSSFTGFSQEMPENASNEDIFSFIIQHKYSNPELAKKYAKILVAKSKKEQDSIHLYKGHVQCCKIANIEGNYEEAIQQCDAAIAIAKILKDQIFLAEVYLTKGNILVYLGEDKEALNNYMNTLNIAKKIQALEYEIAAKTNIAKIKRNMGFYEEALSIYKNSVLLAEQHNFKNKTFLINSYMGVGGTYLRIKKPDSTIKYSKIGLQKSLAINDMEGVSYFYIDIGIANFIKKNFNVAIEYLKKAEKISKGLNNQNRLPEIYNYIGRSYFELKKYDNAISFLKNAEAIVNEENKTKKIPFNPHELEETYLTLSKIYELTNNRDSYVAYTSKYFELKGSNEGEKIEVIKDLYKTTQEENTSLSSLALQLKNSLTYVILFSLFLVALCGYFVWKFLKVKKQNKVIFEQLVTKVDTKKVEKSKLDFTIEDKKVAAILERLDKLEESLFFLNSNCTLQSLAKKAKTNTNYLSKIINKYKQKKFYKYLNDLRIQYVLKRLKEDPKFRKYSIKHIAEEIGYKSTNSFTKYFKASTKLYPSYYIKNLEEITENDASN